MHDSEISAITLSLLMGFCSVALNLVPGVATAWIFSRCTFRGKALLETFVFLPLVIPPVVTGYFLIRIFNQQSLVGAILNRLDVQVVFTWTGMAVASAVMSFALLVRTVRGVLDEINPRLEQAARSLGYSPLRTFFKVTLPLAWPGIVAGSVLCFARTLGEFGATVMISAGTAGNRTIPLEIFHHYQTPGHETEMMRLVVVSIAISSAALVVSEMLIARLGATRYRPHHGG